MRITYKQLATLISQMPPEAQALDVAIVNSNGNEISFVEGFYKIDGDAEGDTLKILGLDTPVLQINHNEIALSIF